MKLFSFLEYIDEFEDIYIRFKGEKIALSLELFKIKRPTNWGLYSVRRVYADNNSLIIEIYKV